jgi:hypothetical protein
LFFHHSLRAAPAPGHGSGARVVRPNIRRWPPFTHLAASRGLS